MCGLPCRRGGPCPAREQVRRALFVAESATAEHHNLLSAMLLSANAWALKAGVCELPEEDPRRDIAVRLLRGGWLPYRGRLTEQEREAALAVLLDTAATLVN